MSDRHVRLKDALRARRWQTYRTFCREYDRVAAVVDSHLTGTWPSKAQFHRWLAGDIKGLPYPDHCRVLERMLPDWSAEQLFELCGPTCPQEVAAASSAAFTGSVERSIADGLADPRRAADLDWGTTEDRTGTIGVRRMPADNRTDENMKELSLAELMTRKLLALGQIQRISPGEIAQLSTLAGNIVDLSTSIDLSIAVDGLCNVTYRYHTLNLTDHPIDRMPRDLWFQHSRGKLELSALREGPTRIAIQRLHTADNMAKFACQLSPAIEPGESATFGYTCSGAEFKEDYYWRQSIARYTRQFTLQVKHEGINLGLSSRLIL